MSKDDTVISETMKRINEKVERATKEIDRRPALKISRQTEDTYLPECIYHGPKK